MKRGPTASHQADELAPRVAVAGRVGGRARRTSPRGRARGSRPVPSRERVGDDDRRRAPAQPVLLEPQPAHVRRAGAERVERAEAVVREAGLGQRRAAHGAARLGLRLEHEDLPARVGEQVGGDEPVRARADDDGVRHGRRTTRGRRRLLPDRARPARRPCRSCASSAARSSVQRPESTSCSASASTSRERSSAPPRRWRRR